jgi:hypothetical protein
LLRRASTTSHSAWIVSPAEGVIQSRFSAGTVLDDAVRPLSQLTPTADFWPSSLATVRGSMP